MAQVQKVKAGLFSIGHLFTAIFKVVRYRLHLYFPSGRLGPKNRTR